MRALPLPPPAPRPRPRSRPCAHAAERTALPFVRKPETDPYFEPFFGRQWIETFTLSLQNFLQTVFHSLRTLGRRERSPLAHGVLTHTARAGSVHSAARPPELPCRPVTHPRARTGGRKPSPHARCSLDAARGACRCPRGRAPCQGRRRPPGLGGRCALSKWRSGRDRSVTILASMAPHPPVQSHHSPLASVAAPHTRQRA